MVEQVKGDEDERRASLVQIRHRMKQLLRGRFLPPNYKEYIFYAYQRCT